MEELIKKPTLHAITRELEERRVHDLDVRLCNNLYRDAYESLSWEANSSMSGVFLLLPPDQLGFINPFLLLGRGTFFLNQKHILPYLGF